LGTRNVVQQRICRQFPGARWWDNTWATWSSADGSIEFGLPPRGEVDYVVLNVRGGTGLVPPIIALAKRNGWQAADCGNGQFLDQVEHPEAGLNQWLDGMHRLLTTVRATRKAADLVDSWSVAV